MSAFRIVTEDERLARPRRIKGVVIGLEAPGAELAPNASSDLSLRPHSVGFAPILAIAQRISDARKRPFVLIDRSGKAAASIGVAATSAFDPIYCDLCPYRRGHQQCP